MGLLGSIGSAVKGLFVIQNIASIGLTLTALLVLRGYGIYLTLGLFSPLAILLGDGWVNALCLCGDFLVVMFFASIIVWLVKALIGRRS